MSAVIHSDYHDDEAAMIFSPSLLDENPDEQQAVSSRRASAANRNLSRVLEDIRDDGPASGYRQAVDSDNGPDGENAVSRKPVGVTTGHAASVSMAQPDATAAQTGDDQLARQSRYVQEQIRQASHARQADRPRTAERPKAATAEAPSRYRSPWMFVVLSGMFSILMCILFYQIKVESREVKDAFLQYQQEMAKRQMAMAPLEMKTTFERLDRKVSDLGKQLGSVRSGAEHQDDQVGDEIRLLRSELVALKKTIQTAKKAPLPAASVTAGKPAGEKANEKPVKGRFVANFSSFLDRQKAEMERQKLSSYRIDVTVRRVFVDGKYLYRLSRDGFASRAEAMRFIDRVERRYGLSGWVKPL